MKETFSQALHIAQRTVLLILSTGIYKTSWGKLGNRPTNRTVQQYNIIG